VEPIVALHPAFCGRGYASEAIRALMAHAADGLGLRRLAAAVDVPNAASIRLVERLGFRPVAETPGPRYRLRHFVLDVVTVRSVGQNSTR
jgi:RimJ/RimL family protein N-acetyltransferase